VTGPRQYPLPLPHRPALGAADFLVSPSNEIAVRWIDRWPDWPAPALVIVGPEGAGKSHLAQVFAGIAGAACHPGAAVDDALAASVAAAAPAAVVIDDAGLAPAPTALLHVFNLQAARGGHLLLTARTPPARWGLALADLRSRLASVPLAEIGPPDDALLAGVAAKLFADRGIAVDPETVGYLVARIERSFAAVRRAVAAIDAHALAAGRRVAIPLVRTALPDLLHDELQHDRSEET
jgi:chromosomal replication initiation ATPase DnaA